MEDIKKCTLQKNNNVCSVCIVGFHEHSTGFSLGDYVNESTIVCKSFFMKISTTYYNIELC